MPGNTKSGKYHCTVDPLFDWFGNSCMTTDNFCFYLQNRLIQTSQTGGVQYSDTSAFSIPWLCSYCMLSVMLNVVVPYFFPILVKKYTTCCNYFEFCKLGCISEGILIHFLLITRVVESAEIVQGFIIFILNFFTY